MRAVVLLVCFPIDELDLSMIRFVSDSHSADRDDECMKDMIHCYHTVALLAAG